MLNKTVSTVAVLLAVLVCLSAASDAWDDDYNKEQDLSKVTCGSVVKLRAKSSGYRLHSHDIKYGGGSGQQSVTGVSKADDPNSFWIVKEGHEEEPCQQGKVILNGNTIRLQHVVTGTNLHTHEFPAPLSGSAGFEVSAYGHNGSGDFGDNWVLELIDAKEWTRGSLFKLKNQQTGNYLVMDPNKAYGRPIAGQLEVKTVVKSRSVNDDAKWYSEEGIYFPAVSTDD